MAKPCAPPLITEGTPRNGMNNKNAQVKTIEIHPGEMTDLALAEVFTDIIIKGKNQNVICLVEGKFGTGKSNATKFMACWCAVILANHFGGVPSDYFNIGHIAVMMPDEIFRVINVMRKPASRYHVYDFDDFGVGYSNRKWQSKPNEAMNNVMQTMRPNNNIVFMSVADADWIDIKGRNMLRFKIVMDKPIISKRLEKIGKSVGMGRLTEVQKMYNSSSRKNIYPYLKACGKIYNRVIFSKIPNELEEVYELARKVQLKRLEALNVETVLDDMINKKGEKVKDVSREDAPKVTKKEKAWEVKRDVEAGIYPTLKAGCEAAGLNYKYTRNILAGFC